MRSGFFDSNITGYDEEGMPVFDHAVDSAFFARYFAALVSNGVFMTDSTQLQVVATSGLKVQLNPGLCMINGYFGWQEDPEEFAIDPSPDGNRITAFMARLNLAEGSINPYIVNGTLAQNPVAPTVTRPAEGESGDIYDICLAQIRVGRNVARITQSDITDTRLDRDVCGVVTGLIDQVDTTTLYNQIQADLANFRNVTQAEYNTWTAEKKAAYDAWVVATQGQYNDFVQATQDEYNTWTAEKKAAYDKWVQDRDTAFMAWWDTIKGTLDGDTAGNLMNLINGHKADHENPHQVDKEQIGLGNVPNVVPYHAGNKPTKADLGLENVDNTSDAAKPISAATQAALNTKLDKSGGNISNINVDNKMTAWNATWNYGHSLGELAFVGGKPETGSWPPEPRPSLVFAEKDSNGNTEWGKTLYLTKVLGGRKLQFIPGGSISSKIDMDVASGRIYTNGRSVADYTEIYKFTPILGSIDDAGKLYSCAYNTHYNHSYYTRLGNRVFINIYMNVAITSEGASNTYQAMIRGLPYTPSEAIFAPAFIAGTLRYYWSTDKFPANTPFMVTLHTGGIVQIRSASGVNATTWGKTDNAWIWMSFSYPTNY